MATTTNAKAARRAARESALAANAELARRTKLNVDDLTRFFASMSRARSVDDWLSEKVAALEEQAARRRDGERREAGAALAAMRGRGEQIRDIARLARVNEKQVRELLRHAEVVPSDPADGTAAGGAASIEPRAGAADGSPDPAGGQSGSTDRGAGRPGAAGG